MKIMNVIIAINFIITINAIIAINVIIANDAIIAILNIIIINTRPKPAYGRQGLARSWGQDTDEVSTFLVFLTSHFAPAALSSYLKIP